MRGVAFFGSREATVFNALTWVSSRTAARAEPAPPAGAFAAACCAGAAVGGRIDACCDPMIQPAMRPNSTPAIPKAMASDFMEARSDHIPESTFKYSPTTVFSPANNARDMMA